MPEGNDGPQRIRAPGRPRRAHSPRLQGTSPFIGVSCRRALDRVVGHYAEPRIAGNGTWSRVRSTASRIRRREPEAPRLVPAPRDVRSARS